MKLLHQLISTFFLSGCSDYNALKVRRACRSKAKARAAFESNNLPYAQGTTFISPFSVFKFAQEYGFPLVIKPNVGGFSRGAYFPIENYKQLLRASIGVKKWWPVSVVESYLLGKNYRVVMTKKGLMSVLRRYPPFIIGNGKQNIGALIDDENALRTSKQLAPVIRHIPKDSAIKRYLEQQKMDFDTVLNAGQKTYLHHKISLKLGASVEVIDKRILSKKNIQDLQRILDYFDANVLGIDVICQQGINVDFNAQKCIFLELNSRPFLKMHDQPRYGEREDLSDFYDYLKQIEISDNAQY